MRYLTFLATGLLLFLHVSGASAAVNIFACEPEWAALAKEIGGDNVNVTAATAGTQDPHHVRAKPSLLAAMRKADMVFCTGAGLEAGWLPVLMQQAAPATVQPGNAGNFIATSYVRLMDAPVKVDRAMGDVHPEGNPHIQTDPRSFLAVAKPFAERLSKIDPANASGYQKRLNDFTQSWQASIKKWQAQASALRGAPVIVYHDNWNYLNRWLGIREVATLEVKPGIPPTPSHLQEVLTASNANNVRAIILAPFDDDEAAHWLAEKTGAKVIHLPFTVGGMAGTETLSATFDKTVAQLQGAVK